jgi:hypothetical protein
MIAYDVLESNRKSLLKSFLVCRTILILSIRKQHTPLDRGEDNTDTYRTKIHFSISVYLIKFNIV